jgi:hypothetical protein
VSSLNLEKLANAFVPDATPSALLAGAALDSVNRYGKKHGGLWVGGKITITPDGLRFAPNRMNTALHQGLDATYIPMASIKAVTREFGWLTGIVVVRHLAGEFRFRCFGATQVAAALAAHVAAR